MFPQQLTGYLFQQSCTRDAMGSSFASRSFRLGCVGGGRLAGASLGREHRANSVPNCRWAIHAERHGDMGAMVLSGRSAVHREHMALLRVQPRLLLMPHAALEAISAVPDNELQKLYESFRTLVQV